MNMALRPMQAHEFPQVYRLMEQAFPAPEYRCFSDAERLLTHPAYEILVLDAQDGILGFIAHWKLDGFCFIEHFAVGPLSRGKGHGGAILRQYLRQCPGPVILEVEAPTTSIAKRRIAFYQRTGFTLSSVGYDQPPLQAGNEHIPLLLMHHPSAVSAELLQRAQREIFRCVYGALGAPRR